MDKIYDTGKLASELGCDKFFITRAVPPSYSKHLNLKIRGGYLQFIS